MKTEFHHGPCYDPDYYQIGPFLLNEQEAMEVAYTIMGHFRPKMLIKPKVLIESNEVKTISPPTDTEEQ